MSLNSNGQARSAEASPASRRRFEDQQLHSCAILSFVDGQPARCHGPRDLIRDVFTRSAGSTGESLRHRKA